MCIVISYRDKNAHTFNGDKFPLKKNSLHIKDAMKWRKSRKWSKLIAKETHDSCAATFQFELYINSLKKKKRELKYFLLTG